MSGFTLVEMLVVVAIMVVLAAILTPAATTMLKGNQLTQAGRILTDQLALARQTALSKNRSVEVRFYRMGDSEIPGETATNPIAGKYRALQILELQADGSVKALGKVQRLPSATILDSSGTLSSILNQSERPEAAPSDGLSIPGAGNSYRYSFFRFRPDGSTDLLEPSAPTKAWFLTIHELQKGDGLNTPPPNFCTVQIDAYNGTLRTFRP